MSQTLAQAYEVRSWHAFTQEITRHEGKLLERPLIKAAAGVVIRNPYANAPFEQDLTPLTEPSHLLGKELGRRARALLGTHEAESYGKGGIAGLHGSQEHLVACITTVFGDAFREAIGGGQAWISSTTKVAGAGTSIDIPLAFKDEVYVRAYYDAITFAVPEGPKEDELLIVCAVASGPRPNQRVGGMTKQEALAERASTN